MPYTIGATNKPKVYVDPGEILQIETQDAYSDQIRKEGDKRDLTKMPYNLVSGPIYVSSAEKGDTLTVTIQDIKPLIGQGATRISSFWYPADYDTELIQKMLRGINVPHGTKICPIHDRKVLLDNFELQYAPMIGTIGTADPVETYSTEFPGPHGGNMDLREITIGATIHLPVRVERALLHVGDVHAVQGDGELSGSAVEMPSLTTLRVDLIKGRSINWPRLENNEALFVVTATENGRTMEDAMRLAFLELIFLLEDEFAFDRWDAFELLSMVSTIRIGNFWTVAVGIPKQYLLRKRITV